jgi:hypothetical protein
MASLIMAVTVLLWVALTVPGWAVQAMVAPVLTVLAVAEAQVMAAPVPTAVLAAAQAMAAPVHTEVLAAAVQGMAAPVHTGVPVVAILVVQGAARAMAVQVLMAGVRARTSRTRVSSRRAARAALLRCAPAVPDAVSDLGWDDLGAEPGSCFRPPIALLARSVSFTCLSASDRAFASNVSRGPKRKTRSRL